MFPALHATLRFLQVNKPMTQDFGKSSSIKTQFEFTINWPCIFLRSKEQKAISIVK